jgi:RNA polymerase sigma-70 factor (ECF subfamily)
MDQRCLEEGEMILIQQTINGNQSAFNELLQYYAPRLYPYLLQMLGDREHAHDISQETFITLFQELPRWKRPTKAVSDETVRHPLAPWIYRIATNKALTLIRREKMRLQRQEINAVASSSQIASLPEDIYLSRELLHEALLRVSEEDALCLVLHFVNGERYGDIARRLGLSSEAVRKRIQRGLTALRKTYKESGFEVHV